MTTGLAFETFGREDVGAPTIVLSAGLGGMGAFWRPQIASLVARFRVVTYDQRGTGANAEALPPGYAISDMADDVRDIVARLGCVSVHFVGHAFGGLVGLELADTTPEVIRSLTLVNAWSVLLNHTRRCFQARLEMLAVGGAASYVRAQPIFLYPASWLEDNHEAVEREVAEGVRHFQGEANLKARLRALEAFEMTDRLERIQAPALVIGALDDVLVPVQASTRLAERLPHAALHLMHGGHGCSRTAPSAFNDVLVSFLTERTGR